MQPFDVLDQHRLPNPVGFHLPVAQVDFLLL
jgi:hypothetical protein